MADFFASDVHLRIDRPERGRRLARLVDQLNKSDTLTVVGDLCDFWFAARQRKVDPMNCAGLRSLSEFRERGGAITVLAGNHDAWLGPFYEEVFGATFLPDSLDVVLHGLKVHAVHGHRMGARSLWKATMESSWFLDAFTACPDPVAARLEQRLEQSNQKHRHECDRRHIELFRKRAREMADTHDLVLIGHIHQALDEPEPAPRMVVLGGWHHRSSFLRIDDQGAQFIVARDDDALQAQPRHP